MAAQLRSHPGERGGWGLQPEQGEVLSGGLGGLDLDLGLLANLVRLDEVDRQVILGLTPSAVAPTDKLVPAGVAVVVGAPTAIAIVTSEFAEVRQLDVRAINPDVLVGAQALVLAVRVSAPNLTHRWSTPLTTIRHTSLDVDIL